MKKYRTHTCGELNKKNKDQNVLLSGWINKKRDHGNLLFIDLRDNYGQTQCVIDKKNKLFKDIEKIPLETVIKINGVDKELVAKIAADIKGLKPVEPYKAKGIKERGQFVLRKEGKKK